MKQWHFYCYKCKTERVIYTVGQVLCVPCPQCGGAMRNLQLKQSHLKLGHVRVVAKQAREARERGIEVTIDDVGPMWEQITLWQL
ncbi:hypothetical protein D2Q93_04190 [Alicyclobacillaceae bacterium I2511]|nr:hypothetical protein D2Q93_04190 [Alicyclobacillaceae bacterium I2511]